MDIKPCQIVDGKPCADRGFVCLTTQEEREDFNRQLDMLIKILESSKIKETSE